MYKHVFLKAIKLCWIVFGLSNSMVMASLTKIDCRNISELIAGEVPDSMVLGRGQVSNTGSHQGFRVWLETAFKGNKPGQYILRGKKTGKIFCGFVLKAIAGKEPIRAAEY